MRLYDPPAGIEGDTPEPKAIGKEIILTRPIREQIQFADSLGHIGDSQHRGSANWIRDLKQASGRKARCSPEWVKAKSLCWK